MTARTALIAVALAAVLVARPFQGRVGGAESPALRAQAPPQQPTFRTEANYIRVDVYATKDGVPVHDLTLDDFEIVENNAAQKIEQFERIEIRGRTMGEQGREPASVADSREMLQNPRARVFVLFLDLGHVNQVDSRRVSAPLVAALDNLIGGDDLIAVMTPSMSVADITFARKITSVRSFIDREWWGERDLTAPNDPVEQSYCVCYPPEPGEGATTCGALAREMIARRREKQTLDALEDLVTYLRVAREERKAILAITNGWTLFGPSTTLERPASGRVPTGPTVGIDPRTGRLSTDDQRNNPYGVSRTRCDADRMSLARLRNADQYRELLDQANRGNASFYPINPAGLDAAATVEGVRDIRDRTETLRTLAESTDGVPVVDTNDLSTGFRRIVTDLSSYYLLGYYSNAPLDGRFHPIKVRVKRPGVQVRARRGYVAASPSDGAAANRIAGATAPDAQMLAVQAALAPLGAFQRELPLRVHAAAGWKPGAGGTPVVGFWVVGEFGPGPPPLRDLDVSILDASGATVGRGTGAGGARSVLVPIEPGGPTPPGEYTVRVRGEGVGTATVRVALPAAPEAGGALMTRRGQVTGNKDVPTADLRFRRNERIRIDVPTVADDPVTARLLDRTGKPLPVPVAATLRADPDGSRWQSAQLALAPLAAGDYLIELSGGAGRSGGAGGGDTEKRVLVAFRIVP